VSNRIGGPEVSICSDNILESTLHDATSIIENFCCDWSPIHWGARVRERKSSMTEDVRQQLREIYDWAVDQRERQAVPPWEIAQRDAFFEHLRLDSAGSLLDLGAATGADSEFFTANGLRVISTNISPKWFVGVGSRVSRPTSWTWRTFDSKLAPSTWPMPKSTIRMEMLSSSTPFQSSVNDTGLPEHSSTSASSLGGCPSS
jgi:hypothetical protein